MTENGGRRQCPDVAGQGIVASDAGDRVLEMGDEVLFVRTRERIRLSVLRHRTRLIPLTLSSERA